MILYEFKIHVNVLGTLSLLITKKIIQLQEFKTLLNYFDQFRPVFAVFKLIEIVILWVYYTIPFGFSFFRHFLDIIFQPIQQLSLAKDH